MKLEKEDIITAIRNFMERTRRFIRSKTREQWMFIGLSVATGILSFLFFIDQIVMPLYLRAGQVVTVPDLAGKAWMDAYHLARKNQLIIARDGSEPSETIAKHHVVTQRPIAGSLVKPGRRIYVMVSNGPEKIKVPDLLGKKTEEAEDIIRDTGLTIGDKQRKRSHKVPPGRVIHQSPKSGTEVKSGAVVNMQISR